MTLRDFTPHQDAENSLRFKVTKKAGGPLATKGKQDMVVSGTI